MSLWCHSAEITWDNPQTITGNLADFDTIGTPVYQWNGGGGSVTVDPAGLNLTFEPGPSLGSIITNTDPHNRGGDVNYETLLGTMTWANSDTSLNLTGLTVAHRYRIQLWMADTRSCCSGRQKTYDSGSGSNQVTLDSGPPSQFVVGTFTADAPTQTIRFVGSNAEHPQYNAIALRTLGAPVPVINSFIASYAGLTSDTGIHVSPGSQVDLDWQVTDADTITISPGVGTVSSSGSTQVSPTTTTTYTLTAENTYGTIQKTVTIYINPAIAPPRLNEIVANNSSGLQDEDGATEDWIELYNPNPFVIDAGNYRLTDDPTLTSTWSIPAATYIPANGYLIVFASGKNRTGAELHTDFRLDSDGDYLALTNPDGTMVLEQLPNDYPTSLEYPGIPKDSSYGYNDSDQINFFDTPTPMAANGNGFLGFTKDTSFDFDRGFYENPFNLIISSASLGATIRYTTDGSIPSETHGTIYSGPIPISQTTVIRAIAYQAGYRPTNVDTHTYIFASDVITSGVMDTAITQNATYGPQMIDSLKALPVISLNIENNNSLDNSTEQRVSIEYILADGTKGFQEDAGVTHFGGYFTNFAKKNFRLYFRKQYGVGKLEYPLFKGFESGKEHGILPVETFDALDLRTGSHDMAMRGAYLSNRFTDDALLEMGNISPHGRFVHVFRNGVYWGQYHLRERWSASMASEYFGGAKENYEAINGNANVGGWSPGVAYDGDGNTWTTIKNLANSSTPWASLQPRLDLQSYLDFWILYDFGSSENEYRAFGQDIDNGLTMKLYLNDADGWTNPTGIAQNNDPGGPGNILGRLEWENHPDFKTYFADRIYAAYFHDGAFSATSTVARIQGLLERTRVSFLCESARWGYRTPQSYYNYHNNLINNQFPGQTASRLNDLRNAGRYPNVDAPEYNQNGGLVSPGFGVFFTSSSSGTIYYTTDGSDPRLPGGAVNPDATPIAGSTGSLTLLPAGSTWKYLDNGSNQGTAWRQPAFDDSLWASGNAKLGYGDGNEATTVSFGGNSSNKFITTYFRKTFNVTGASSITGLTLSLLRDDGAVIYLNGQEIVRSNMPTGTISYTTLANGAIGGSDEQAFYQFNVSPSLLLEGSNTLAVEIHQAAVTSSDIGFNLSLNATTGITSPELTITNVTTLKARTLHNGTWSAIHPATFIPSLPPVTPQPGHLVISELHYHPSGPTSSELTSIPTLTDDDFEFLEIMNIHSEPVQLDNCIFTDGIDYIFPEDSILQPGERMVLVNNPDAFQLRHPGVSLSLINGSYGGALRNSDERIVLKNTSDTTLIDFGYGDGTDRGSTDDLLWPSTPDGGGESLVLIHPAHGGDLNNPMFWRPSDNNDGAPGTSDARMLPADPTIDSDLDGYMALIEQSLTSSDSDAADMPLTQQAIETLDDGTSSQFDFLTLTFTRDALTETYLQVETSSTLNGWTDNAVLVSRTIHSDGTETLKYRFPVPVPLPGSQAEQFMRVRVTH